MGYEALDHALWSDNWFLGLASDAKVLFLFLTFHTNAKRSGVWSPHWPSLPDYLNLTPRRLHTALAVLVESGKVNHWPQTGRVWVRNRAHYTIISPATAQGIRYEIDALDDRELRAAWLAYRRNAAEPTNAELLAKHLGNGHAPEAENPKPGDGPETVPGRSPHKTRPRRGPTRGRVKGTKTKTKGKGKGKGKGSKPKDPPAPRAPGPPKSGPGPGRRPGPSLGPGLSPGPSPGPESGLGGPGARGAGGSLPYNVAEGYGRGLARVYREHHGHEGGPTAATVTDAIARTMIAHNLTPDALEDALKHPAPLLPLMPAHKRRPPFGIWTLLNALRDKTKKERTGR